MGPYLYRCPTTGYRVQGWAAGEAPDPGEDRYEMVECIACQGVHLVNPANGKVLGSGDFD